MITIEQIEKDSGVTIETILTLAKCGLLYIRKETETDQEYHKKIDFGLNNLIYGGK